MTAPATLLAGWGNFPRLACRQTRPRGPVALAAEPRLIVRGMGRAYGDAALCPALTLDYTAHDSLLAFDREAGVVRAMAGLTMGELLKITLPAGWCLAVIPGTRHVTLGGAVAANVHGKNHVAAGGFIRHVISLRLQLANGQSVTCSVTEQPELFYATAGGMGMTGVIEEVTLQLIPVRSSAMQVTRRKVPNLKDMLGAFARHADASYRVGWIDQASGRGIFEAAEHGENAMEYLPARTVNVPQHVPKFLLNRFGMALYNRQRLWRSAEGAHTVPFDDFFFPLDRLAHWNRLYGQDGLIQYQCLLPDAGALPRVLEAAHGSYLTVLKAHGADAGDLCFAGPGYSLAFDFPNRPGTEAVLGRLDELVLQAGGRVYLAKDARLPRATFERMYGEQLQGWKEELRRIDPGRKFMSAMAERLGFKDGS